MERGLRGLAVRAALGAVAAFATTGLVFAPAAGAAPPRRAPSAAIWTDRFCRGLVDFQASALDARDVTFPAARTPVADRAQALAAAKRMRRALVMPTERLHDLATDAARVPHTKHGAQVVAATTTALAPVVRAYERAEHDSGALATATPAGFATRAAAVLTRLDRSLTKAEPRLTRLETVVHRSTLGGMVYTTPSCNRVGLEWSGLPTVGSTGPTPAPDAMAVDQPGYDDEHAPAILLPHRYRPTPAIAAIAARTTMTGLARTVFYSGEPRVETGQAFAADCPTREASTILLGCFHNHHIYVLDVTRPELARIVDVSAAHEMLHGAYDAYDAAQHAQVDPLMSAYYDASADPRLRDIVAQYDRLTPKNRASELHSLIVTQEPVLTPELAYYASGFFHDRSVITADYDATMSVFENLLDRYDDLRAQLDDLKRRIDGVEAQADAAAAEARGLGAQIDSLRAQGRTSESNALVPPQNAAVDRARALAAQANALISRYNALVDEINGVGNELGGLQSALRPLG